MEEITASSLGTLTPRTKQISCEYSFPCLQHSHTAWEFSIFLEGKYRNHINDRDYIAVANRVFILGPNHVHSLKPLGKENRYRDIYITDPHFETLVKNCFDASLWERLNSAQDPVFFDLSPQCMAEVLPRLKKLSSIGMLNFKYDSQRKIANSIITYLLGILIEKDYIEKQPYPSWFLQMFSQLQDPVVFCKHISDIIETTNYSHSQFGMLFKKYTNQSLVNFIGNIRLEYSLELLNNERMSVLDIAYTVGYNSVSHYINKFKKKYGITPLQYRKSKAVG